VLSLRLTNVVPVSLCLYSDSRAQVMGDTSGIPKDKIKGKNKKEGKARKKENRKKNEWKSFKTDLIFSILKRRLV
jgi:hypothetical protein